MNPFSEIKTCLFWDYLHSRGKRNKLVNMTWGEVIKLIITFSCAKVEKKEIIWKARVLKAKKVFAHTLILCILSFTFLYKNKPYIYKGSALKFHNPLMLIYNFLKCNPLTSYIKSYQRFLELQETTKIGNKWHYYWVRFLDILLCFVDKVTSW